MFARAFISLGFFSLAAPLFADMNNRGILELLPIRGLAFEGKRLNLAVILPCDAEPVGVYFDHQQTTGDQRIAYLVRRQSVVCAGMPRLHTEVLRGLAYGNIKRLVKMSPGNFPKRLALVYADEVLRAGTDRPEYTALAAVKCGSLFGSVWSGRSSGANIALVGQEVKKDDVASCAFSYQTVALPYLDASLLGVKALRPDSEPEQGYDLQIKNITSYKRLSADKTVFGFKRRCNEVPLALLVGGASQEASTLGILTARFMNKRCGRHHSFVADTFELKGYALPYQAGLKSFAASKGFAKFHLKAPKAALLDRSSLEVNYLKTCDDAVALAVYPGERKAAVAVLEYSRQTPCNLSPKEVSFKGSLASTDLGETKVFPLQLGGSAYY